MIDNLSKSIAQIDLNKDDEFDGSKNNGFNELTFVENQTKIVQLTKSIQQNVKDMSICNVNELGQYAQQITQAFNSLILASKSAINKCNDNNNGTDLASRIRVTTQDLGKVI